jgi:hypothetical protein
MNYARQIIFQSLFCMEFMGSIYVNVKHETFMNEIKNIQLIYVRILRGNSKNLMILSYPWGYGLGLKYGAIFCKD